MSQTAPPPDDLAAAGSLAPPGAALTGWLISEIRLLWAARAGALDLRFLRALIRHYLVPAEAAFRRVVFLLAASLPARAAPPRGAPPRPPARPGPGARPASRPRAPCFRLGEAQPRPKPRYAPVSQRPLISVPGVTPRPLPRAAPRPVTAGELADRFLRRLAALEAALADPAAAARRLQRLRRRKTGRAPALSLRKIPGLGAEPLHGPGAQLLSDLNTAAGDLAPAIAADTS